MSKVKSLIFQSIICQFVMKTVNVQYYFNLKHFQMEISLGKIQKTVLPLLNQLTTLRNKYKPYSIIICIIQLYFCFTFLFADIKNISQDSLSIITNMMQIEMINDELVISIFSYFAFIYTFFFIALTIFFIQQFRKTSNQMAILVTQINYKQTTLVYLYFILEILIVPTFLTTNHNLQNQLFTDLATLNWITLPCIVCLILADKDCRIFNSYLIPLIITHIIFGDNISEIVICLISIKLISTQRSLLKKTIYSQFLWWQFYSLVAAYTKISVCALYIVIISFIILPLVYFSSEKECVSDAEENNKLLDFINKVKNQNQVNEREMREVSKIINKFKANLDDTERKIFQQNQLIFIEKQQNFSKEYLTEFLHLKIKYQHSRNPCFIFQIQRVELRIISEVFSTQHLYEVQCLNKSNQKSKCLKDALRVYQLIQNIEAGYLRKNQTINASVIINTQRQIERFYEGINQLNDMMIQFWSDKLYNKLTELTMKKTLIRVLKLESKMQEILKNIQNIRKVKIQAQVLNYLMKLINNSFVEIAMNDFKKYNRDNLENFVNTNFVLIQGQKIIDISSQIANELSMDKIQIQDTSKDHLFPMGIKRYIHHHTDRLIGFENGENVMILPFMVNDGQQHILPYRCKFQIIPHLMNDIQYIIHFLHSDDLRSKPIFLYSANDDRIIHISSNFLQYFQLQDFAFKYECISQQLFGIDIGQMLKERTYQSNQMLHCDMNMKSFINRDRKSGKAKKLYVQVRCVQQYQNINQTLMLIQIGKRQKLTDEKEKHDSIVQFFTNRQGLQVDASSIYRKDYFITTKFCKIANPYQNVIDQKMSKIKTMNKLSYLKLTWIVLFLILLIAGATLLYMMTNVNSIFGDIDYLLNKNNQKQSDKSQIYLIYIKYYKYFQLVNYPDSYSKTNPSENITALTLQYRNQLDSDISVLLRQLISYEEMNDYLDYQIRFKNYNVSANTQMTTFVDLLQYLKLTLANNKPQFILKNALGISLFASTFNSQPLAILDNFIQRQLYGLYILLAIVLFLLVLLKIIDYKVKEIILSVFDLFIRIDRESTIKTGKRLKHFKQILSNSTHFKGIMSKKKWENQIGKEENDQKNKMSHTVLIKQKTNEECEVLLANNIVQQIKPEQKSKIQYTKGNSYFKFYTVCLIPIILVIFLLINLQQIQIFKDQQSDIYQYYKNLQNAVNKINRRCSEFYHSGMWDLFHEGFKDTKQINKVLVTDLNRPLPTFFKNYQTIKNQMISYDLCNIGKYISSDYINDINCSYILGGVLQLGFQSTIQLYFSLIDKYIGLDLRNYDKTFRVGATYPVSIEVSYIQSLLNNLLMAVANIFNNNLLNYNQYWRVNLLTIVRMGIILLAAILIFSIISYKFISEECRFSLKTFVVIPRCFLLKMSTTKLLKNSNLLDKIEWLDF